MSALAMRTNDKNNRCWPAGVLSASSSIFASGLPLGAAKAGAVAAATAGAASTAGPGAWLLAMASAASACGGMSAHRSPLRACLVSLAQAQPCAQALLQGPGSAHAAPVPVQLLDTAAGWAKHDADGAAAGDTAAAAAAAMEHAAAPSAEDGSACSAMLFTAAAGPASGGAGGAAAAAPVASAAASVAMKRRNFAVLSRVHLRHNLDATFAQGVLGCFIRKILSLLTPSAAVTK